MMARRGESRGEVLARLRSLAASGREPRPATIGVTAALAGVVPVAVVCGVARVAATEEAPQVLLALFLGIAACLAALVVGARGRREARRFAFALALELAVVVAILVVPFLAFRWWAG